MMGFDLRISHTLVRYFSTRTLRALVAHCESQSFRDNIGKYGPILIIFSPCNFAFYNLKRQL